MVTTKEPKAHNYSTYINHRCRCDVCRAANTAYYAKRRAERAAGIVGNGLPAPKEHNESTYTNWGCRCDVCREAWRIASARRRARKNQ